MATKAWTSAEDCELVAYWLEGLSDLEISEHMARGRDAIRSRRRIMNLPTPDRRKNGWRQDIILAVAEQARTVMSLTRQLEKAHRDAQKRERELLKLRAAQKAPPELKPAAPYPPLEPTQGLDDEDLEWMRKYRAQQAQKEARRTADRYL